MGNFNSIKIILIRFFFLMIFIPSFLGAETKEKVNFQIIKLSPTDQKAVIKNLNTNTLEVIGIGYQFKDLGQVIRIYEKCIVLKPDLSKGYRRIILSVENGRQKIVKIGNTRIDRDTNEQMVQDHKSSEKQTGDTQSVTGEKAD